MSFNKKFPSNLTEEKIPSSNDFLEMITSKDFSFNFSFLSKTQNQLLLDYFILRLSHKKLHFSPNQRRMMSDIRKRIQKINQRLEKLLKLKNETEILQQILTFSKKKKQ